ncbi:hypothetical protein O181_017680 [Austropuccinia psidii MF-1]|uniref:Reverse transcriptase Ty1/copia-type domain-containing protein n=1 Tax=Austropuccinia psidii MF-1 TaxID=1389203 RepID=A0A9Q3C783_9BASI|nr:hypothetical protein [Austropuccinia psidii MF-1]
MASILLAIQIDNIFDGSMIKERQFQDSLVLVINPFTHLSTTLPTDYNLAMNSPQANHWKREIKEELHSMKEKDVFIQTTLWKALMEVPQESILSTKWVFENKCNPERYKGHLVARGFRKIQGINIEETFAPTPTFGALKILFSIACTKSWEICAFDVKVAFLHSLIDKSVYLWTPKVMNIPASSVLQLKKELYGTKQASHCWWLQLKMILHQIGFKSNDEDPGTYLFDSKRGQAMSWIHVDNGALAGSSADVLDFILVELNERLEVKWGLEVTGLVGLAIQETLICLNLHKQN